MKSIDTKNKFLILFTFILSLLPTLFIVNAENKLYLDKEVIMTPLENITSLESYIDGVKAYTIFDLQPIRDLSHIIDYRISNLSRIDVEYISIYHNYILLSLILILIYNICNKELGKKIATMLVTFFCLHPVVFNVFIEPTSRKHILSFLFLLILIQHFQKTNIKTIRNKIISALIYVLLCLSQPINILSPFILLIWNNFSAKSIKENARKLLIHFATMLLVAIANIYYFKFGYVKASGFSKFSQIDLGEKLLAIGRMPYQFFFPKDYSMFYYQGATSNILGLLLLVFICFYLYKLKKLKAYKYILLFFATCFTLYGMGTRIFLLTTYLLTPSFAFLMIFGFIYKDIKSKKKVLIYSFIPVLFITTMYQSYLRSDAVKYFESGFRADKSCFNLNTLTVWQLKLNDKEGFKKYAPIWLKRKCMIIKKGSEHIPYVVMANMIYLDEKQSIEEKLELYEKRIMSDHDLIILKSATLLSSNPSGQEFIEINNSLKSLKDIDKNSIFLKESFAGHMLIRACKEKTYPKLECSEFLDYFKRVNDQEVVTKIIMLQGKP